MAVARPALPPRDASTNQSQVFPSHADFLLSQIKASLTQLHSLGNLDSDTHNEVQSLLNGSKPSSRGQEDFADLDSLGKRNAWVRKAMLETDLLPNVVETALGIVGGPFLGDTQIEAIVQLVTMSQNNIAEAVTNPRNQRMASTGAFTGIKNAYGGVNKGIGAANEKWTTKRNADKEKNAKKKEEKEQEKELKSELKREREMFSSASKGQGVALPLRNTTDREDTPQQETMQAASKSKAIVADGSASVVCKQDDKSSSTATTTFTPWPGVVITSTVVANHSLSRRQSASLTADHEERLRTRRLPPLPSASGAPPPDEPTQTTSNLPPPPLHHSRSTLSTRTQNENTMDAGPSSATTTEMQQQHPSQDEVQDMTQAKRSNWKSKLLG
ncbi:unnamed protein product [Sympodiomycopsis kandeliae]